MGELTLVKSGSGSMKKSQRLLKIKPWRIFQPTYRRNRNALFNWCVSQGYFSINPVERVERPQKEETEIKILKIGEVKKLLTTALKYEMYDRLAINVLVLFCGDSSGGSL